MNPYDEATMRIICERIDAIMKRHEITVVPGATLTAALHTQEPAERVEYILTWLTFTEERLNQLQGHGCPCMACAVEATMIVTTLCTAHAIAQVGSYELLATSLAFLSTMLDAGVRAIRLSSAAAAKVSPSFCVPADALGLAPPPVDKDESDDNGSPDKNPQGGTPTLH